MSSQETLTTRKKRYGKGTIRQMWTRVWGKEATRSNEFEEVLQTRSERIRPVISMPILRLAEFVVSMPSLQTPRSSLPVSSPRTHGPPKQHHVSRTTDVRRQCYAFAINFSEGVKKNAEIEKRMKKDIRIHDPDLEACRTLFVSNVLFLSRCRVPWVD
jgi:hypothetical protein